MESPTIATYSLAGGRGETQGCIFQERKTRGSCHQRLFEENVRKTKRGLRILSVKDSGVVFMHGEGIST